MKFHLIVEGPFGGPNGDFLEVSPHALILRGLVWEGDAPPDFITLPGGTVLGHVGRYLARGDAHRYRVAITAKLINGNLEKVENNAL